MVCDLIPASPSTLTETNCCLPRWNVMGTMMMYLMLISALFVQELSWRSSMGKRECHWLRPPHERYVVDCYIIYKTKTWYVWYAKAAPRCFGFGTDCGLSIQREFPSKPKTFSQSDYGRCFCVLVLPLSVEPIRLALCVYHISTSYVIDWWYSTPYHPQILKTVHPPVPRKTDSSNRKEGWCTTRKERRNKRL